MIAHTALAGIVFLGVISVALKCFVSRRPCEREQAEFARDQIHAYGADPRMPISKGSMSAVIEPAGKAT